MSRLVALALLLSSGCYQTTLRTTKLDGYPAAQYEHRWNHQFLGIVEPEGPVMLDEVCPSGVAKIDSETSALNGLAANITYGIYTPQEVTITCARP